jgi:hypothetical protein
VRERFIVDTESHGPDGHYNASYFSDGLVFEFDYSEVNERRIIPGKSYPSIFMPRWASRITLEIVSVRAERVKDITTEDIIAEGLVSDLRWNDACVELVEKWVALWNSINAKRGYPWESNPWVWVIKFKRIDE